VSNYVSGNINRRLNIFNTKDIKPTWCYVYYLSCKWVL